MSAPWARDGEPDLACALALVGREALGANRGGRAHSHRYNHFGRIAHEIMAGFFPTDPPPFFRVAFGYSAIDPIKELLINAGFTDIRIDVVSLEKEFPDPEDFAFSIVHGLPIIEQVQSRSGAEPAVVVTSLAGALRREMAATGRTRFQAILFEARAQ